MHEGPRLLDLEPTHALAIRETVPMSGLPKFFASAFHDLDAAARAQGVTPSGPPFARYFSVTPAAVDVQAAMPVSRAAAGAGRVEAVELPGGAAVEIRHVGAYTTLGETYEDLERWLESHQRTRSDAPREVYVTGPDVEPTITLVIQPIA